MLLSHDRLEKIKWVKPSAVDEEPPKIRIYLFFLLTGMQIGTLYLGDDLTALITFYPA